MANLPTTCEVCGQPATYRFMDLRRGLQGNMPTWKPDGPIHTTCERHRRRPRLKFPSGFRTDRLRSNAAC